MGTRKGELLIAQGCPKLNNFLNFSVQEFSRRPNYAAVSIQSVRSNHRKGGDYEGAMVIRTNTGEQGCQSRHILKVGSLW